MSNRRNKLNFPMVHNPLREKLELNRYNEVTGKLNSPLIYDAKLCVNMIQYSAQLAFNTANWIEYLDQNKQDN